MSTPTRSRWFTAAVLAAAAILIAGCKERKRDPVPPPQSQPAASDRVPGQDGDPHTAHSGRHVMGASGISWFQGTIEEAFSRECTG
jgi:hypothetical protein